MHVLQSYAQQCRRLKRRWPVAGCYSYLHHIFMPQVVHSQDTDFADRQVFDWSMTKRYGGSC